MIVDLCALRTYFPLLYIYSYGKISLELCEVFSNALLAWNTTAMHMSQNYKVIVNDELSI
jgi:hypothetical protein